MRARQCRLAHRFSPACQRILTRTVSQLVGAPRMNVVGLVIVIVVAGWLSTLIMD